jgi:Alginate lyase
VTTSRSRSTYIAACLLAAAMVTSCSTPVPPTGAPPPVPAPVDLNGWKLTLPVAGPRGTAAAVDPARFSPPWLTEDPGGGLTFWAPADGATTAHSTHARTELVGLDVFPAGAHPHALTASLAVTQVPADSQDVILGQIHGADDLKSVPFVMLHYRVGAIEVVVKRQRSGSAADRYTLLSGVPLGARFDVGMRDNGNGTCTFTATYGTEHASRDAPLPAAFSGATVRFQAGAYQQSGADHPSAVDDGARVTFYALTTASG